MANGNKQTESEETSFEMRRSFSWNRAFFTSDGVLDAEELSSMIEGGGDDVKHQLQKIEEIEIMETKLFQEIEASTQKSTGTSDVTGLSINSLSGKKGSQQQKVKAASITPTRSSPCSSGSPAGRSRSSKTGKAEGDSPSKTSVGIAKRNNEVAVTSRMSRTPPASPGSSSSTFSVNQRSKRSSSVPRRSSVNSEKPSAINARRNEEWKTKRNKVTPVNAGMSRTSPASPLSSGSSSSTFSVNQRSKRSSIVFPRRSSVNSEKPSAVNERKNNEWKTMKDKVVPVSTRMSRTPPASPRSSGSSFSTFSVNQRSKRSSSVPRRSLVNSEKSSAGNERGNGEWKTKNKGKPVNAGLSRSSPASPVSSGSSYSTFSIDKRSKRGSSVPRRSTVNSEKPSAINARTNDEWKTSKPAIRLIPKTQSSISLKIKPPPVVSYLYSPSESFNSSSSSTTPSSSSSSSSSASSTCKVNQRSRQVGRSKSTLKHHPTGQTPYRNRKQSAASCTETRSTNTTKTRKLLTPKTAAAVDTGLKPVSQKTTTKPSKRQSSAKAKSSTSISRNAENIILVSPEVLDIKGKLNALKMEISMHKKDKCNKMSHDESGKGESSFNIQMNNQTKSK